MDKKTKESGGAVEAPDHSHDGDNKIVCPDCSSLVRADLTPQQYKEYEEEARVRYLKAQKVSKPCSSSF